LQDWSVDLGLFSWEVANGPTTAGINPNRWLVCMPVDFIPQVTAEGDIPIAALTATRADLCESLLVCGLSNDLIVKLAVTALASPGFGSR
jgi:hypothetical protein